jgi:DNA-binding beta-propeller fold protein YncE
MLPAMPTRILCSAVALFLLAAAVAAAAGELLQKPGTAGCISETGTGGACQNGRALEDPFGIAASQDGRSVYVASISSTAVAVFDRDPATGALTQKPGTAGCISEDGTGGLCQNGTAVEGGFGAVVSADGENVYVAARSAGSVAIFDRDTGSGALTQKPGTAGCISDDGTGGLCANGTGLGGPSDAATSPDGKSVYVASQGSDAVLVLDRDTGTGALTQKPGAAGCISDDGTGGLCEDGIALDAPTGAETSADGKSVYVAALGSDAVAVFDRDPATGALTQKAKPGGCVAETSLAGDCADGTALDDPVRAALSPGGDALYVTSAQSDAVAVFDRDVNTGAIAHKPGAACISEAGVGACQDGTALDFAAGIAVSANSVYVTSLDSDAVAVFDRATPSSPAAPPVSPSTPDTVAPTVSRFRFSPQRFRVRRGARMRFSLSEPANTRVVIDRAVRGRYRRRGAITRHDLPAGARSLRFSGRIGKRALPAGRYRATITATDGAGNRSRPARASFRIASAHA